MYLIHQMDVWELSKILATYNGNKWVCTIDTNIAVSSQSARGRKHSNFVGKQILEIWGKCYLGLICFFHTFNDCFFFSFFHDFYYLLHIRSHSFYRLTKLCIRWYFLINKSDFFSQWLTLHDIMQKGSIISPPPPHTHTCT